MTCPIATSGGVCAFVLLVMAAASGCGRRAGDTLAPSQTIADSTLAASPSAPAASPSATPTPGPAAPQDEAEPSPSPDCIHGTHHGVASVSLAIYFLECGGQRIPGSQELTQVPVGCKIHFNATPRDGSGAPTCSRTWPIWQVGPEALVRGAGGDTFTPAYTAQQAGRMSARCIVDGVRSGWLILDLIER